MHQHDKSILTKSNVQSDVVVVNQCDTDSVEEFDFVNKYGQTKHCIFVSTTQRDSPEVEIWRYLMRRKIQSAKYAMMTKPLLMI